WKIIVTLALVIAGTSLPAAWPFALAALAGVILAIYATSGLAWLYLARRLALAAPFVLVVCAGVPLSRGLAGGFAHAALMLLRGLLALIVTITLVGTTSLPKLLAGLEKLRVPRIFLWILAFMVRYMFVLTEELTRMRRAKEARSA